MKMTDLQFAGISINLVTLGQVDLSDNDPAMLRDLAHLLSDAALNVAKAIHSADAPGPDPLHIGARVIVAVADDMFTGQHATIRDIKRRPRLKRIDYVLDIEGKTMKYGAGPYQADEIVPE
jgi:hypothetical protein